MRAILSVSDHTGLANLARDLESHGIALFSPAATAKWLRAEAISVFPAHELLPASQHPEEHSMLSHPLLLSAFGSSSSTVAEEDFPTHAAERIVVVVLNFPPFATLLQMQTSLSEALTNLNHVGMTLLRAAATHFADVLVLVRPEDYPMVMQEWREQGEVSLETRRRLASSAFQYLASYDAAIAEYLRASTDPFPASLTLTLERVQPLRYGENPHQQAAFYRWSDSSGSSRLPSIASAEVLHGKELSFNNLLDLDAALSAVQSFTAPAVAIIKHTNPCGLACDDPLLDAYKKAHTGDPISAFGGVIGCNRPVDVALALEIAQLYYEAIIAPEFQPEALDILRRKKNIRLLATHYPIEPRNMTTQALHARHPSMRSVSGGVLLQTPDMLNESETEYQVVTEREPTLDEVTDLLFAWKAVRHVRSNAVVLAHKLMLVGVGTGQLNRVGSVRLAVEQAGERARGAVLASDAFFPFADGIELAAKAGVTAIIQPGGSLRDEEALRAANHYAIAMIFTGRRHFRH